MNSTMNSCIACAAGDRSTFVCVISPISLFSSGSVGYVLTLAEVFFNWNSEKEYTFLFRAAFVTGHQCTLLPEIRRKNTLFYSGQCQRPDASVLFYLKFGERIHFSLSGSARGRALVYSFARNPKKEYTFLFRAALAAGCQCTLLL